MGADDRRPPPARTAGTARRAAVVRPPAVLGLIFELIAATWGSVSARRVDAGLWPRHRGGCAQFGDLGWQPRQFGLVTRPPHRGTAGRPAGTSHRPQAAQAAPGAPAGGCGRGRHQTGGEQSAGHSLPVTGLPPVARVLSCCCLFLCSSRSSATSARSRAISSWVSPDCCGDCAALAVLPWLPRIITHIIAPI